MYSLKSGAIQNVLSEGFERYHMTQSTSVCIVHYLVGIVNIL